jgi:hypothetical protein
MAFGCDHWEVCRPLGNFFCVGDFGFAALGGNASHAGDFQIFVNFFIAKPFADLFALDKHGGQGIWF